MLGYFEMSLHRTTAGSGSNCAPRVNQLDATAHTGAHPRRGLFFPCCSNVSSCLVPVLSCEIRCHSSPSILRPYATRIYDHRIVRCAVISTSIAVAGISVHNTAVAMQTEQARVDLISKLRQYRARAQREQEGKKSCLVQRHLA